MSIEDKIRNAKPSDWLTEGIPKWQVWLIVKWAVFKARFELFLRKVRNKQVRCIYDEPLEPYTCVADWNCKDCPNWRDEIESEEQIMAEIVLKIPKEFEQDFNTDKFKEALKRVLWDCKAWNYAKASGRYEHEILEMLLDVFNEAVVLPKGHGDLIDRGELLKQKVRFEDFDGDTFDIIHEETIINAPTIIEADKEGE